MGNSNNCNENKVDSTTIENSLRNLNQTHIPEVIKNTIAKVQEQIAKGYPPTIMAGCTREYFGKPYNRSFVKQTYDEIYEKVVNSGVDVSCIKSFNILANLGFFSILFHPQTDSETMTNFAVKLWEELPESHRFIESSGIVEFPRLPVEKPKILLTKFQTPSSNHTCSNSDDIQHCAENSNFK